jgi:hypothetical protein
MKWRYRFFKTSKYEYHIHAQTGVAHTAQHTRSERAHTQKQTQASVHNSRSKRERENAARRANRSFCDPRRKKVNAKFAAGLHYLVCAQLFTRGRESKFQTRRAKVAMAFSLSWLPTFDNNMLRVYECNVCALSSLSPFRPLCFYLFSSLSSVCHFLENLLGIFANFPRNALSRLAEYYALCCASASRDI